MYTGWRIVGCTSIVGALLNGLFYNGMSAYFLPLQEHFQVSRTRLSFIFALRGLEGGLEGPISGYLTDRLGGRVIMTTGLIWAGIGLVILPFMPNFTTFAIVFLLVVTTGFSMPVHGTMITINRWFRRRLGTALSVYTSGSALGSLVLTPVLGYVIHAHGWRWGVGMSGIVVLCIGVPLALTLRYPRESEMDPKEQQPRASKGNASALNDASGAEHDYSVGEAIRTPTYWMIAASIGFRLLGKSAITVHFVPLLTSKGISEPLAITLLAFSAVPRMFAGLGAGFLGDRWSRSKVSSLCMMVGVSGGLFMLFGPTGLLFGLGFAILIAISQSSDIMTWALISQYFGRRNFGTLRGIATIVQAFVAFSGPLIFGYLYDKNQNYDTAMWIFIGATAGAAALYWFMRPPRRPARNTSRMTQHTPGAPR